MPALLESNTSLDDLMIDFQSSQSKVPEFLALIHPRIGKTVRKYGIDLPEDIRDEVKNETLRLLLSDGRAAFETSRGTAWQYLHGNILNAIQIVRGSYGNKTKPMISKEDAIPPGSIFMPLEAVEHSLADPAAENIYRDALLSEVLGRAKPPLRRALKRIYLEGYDQTSVAGELKISRFALVRQMVALANAPAKLRMCA